MREDINLLMKEIWCTPSRINYLGTKKVLGFVRETVEYQNKTRRQRKTDYPPWDTIQLREDF